MVNLLSLVTNKWHIDQRDVNCSSMSGGTGLRKNSRQSRALTESEIHMTLTHRPTNIEVQGTIKGNGTRNEWTLAKDTLYNHLFNELENKVAKALKIPRR